jgi:signal transduction histidine kinase
VLCPSCQAPIAGADTTCAACGADIQLMALAVEAVVVAQALRGGLPARPVATEDLIPRLGDYLVQRGLITAEQLARALDRQAAGAAGERPLLGQTLLELGCLSSAQLDRAIAQRLLELQSALLEANRSLEQRVASRTAELQAALERVAEYNQLKANFLANVSHELRTPLTHVKGYTDLLREGALGPLTGEQQHALEVTTGAVERLEQLLTDLIAYASAARGQLTLNRRPVALGRVVSQVMERSQPRAERKGIRLTASLAPDLPPVFVDEEKITWTLLQLVDNAVKFTPGGGQAAITAERQGAQVVVEVCDTGAGIAPERQAEIFEVFRQLDGSSTRRHGGTGLGLALVQRILDAHAAPYFVASQPGQGTTFTFRLPAAEP